MGDVSCTKALVWSPLALQYRWRMTRRSFESGHMCAAKKTYVHPVPSPQPVRPPRPARDPVERAADRAIYQVRRGREPRGLGRGPTGLDAPAELLEMKAAVAWCFASLAGTEDLAAHLFANPSPPAPRAGLQLHKATKQYQPDVRDGATHPVRYSVNPLRPTGVR